MTFRTIGALGLMAALLVASHAAIAQTILPVLYAHSPIVDVRDGARFVKGVWVADPSLAFDVYDARRSAQARTVTFVSDLDSLSFDTQPGRSYDFVIVLDGKDSCRTRLSTVMQSFTRVGPDGANGPATIPISIRRGKLHLSGKLNDSRTLDLIFDTGANANALYPSALRKGAKITSDGTTSNVGTGGTTVRKLGRDNRLTIAGLRWEHEPFISIEKQADAADGIVGYTVFEDKVVEVDYDRMVMIVRDSLPDDVDEFAKTAMPFTGSLTSVEAFLVAGDQRASGMFSLDTGGTGTMIVNRAFAVAHSLPGTMRKLGTSQSRGVGSGTVHNDIVLVPELTIAGLTLRNVPVHVERPIDGDAAGTVPSTGAPPGGVLCMDVLRRLDTILDYAHDEAYFKPNARFDAPFRSRSAPSPWFALVSIAALSIVTIAGLALFGVYRRQSAS